MGASVNRVTLLGRLGKDPEVRYTTSGMAVANFSLATDETFKDREGNKQKKTEWHRLVAWDKTAQVVEQYLHKGDLIHIEGKLQTRELEKDGQKRSTTEIVVTNLQMIQTQGNGESNAGPSNSNSRPAANTGRPAAPPQGRPAQRPPQQQQQQGRPAQQARPPQGRPAPAPQQIGPDEEDIPF